MNLCGKLFPVFPLNSFAATLPSSARSFLTQPNTIPVNSGTRQLFPAVDTASSFQSVNYRQKRYFSLETCARRNLWMRFCIKVWYIDSIICKKVCENFTVHQQINRSQHGKSVSRQSLSWKSHFGNVCWLVRGEKYHGLITSHRFVTSLKTPWV